jgi:hypothetical protein
MATVLRLVWSSAARRAPAAQSTPPAGVAEARALVDDWVCTPFDSAPAALDDLVMRVATALRRVGRPTEIATDPPGKPASGS